MVLGVLQSRSSPPKTSPKKSAPMDGLQRSAERGFKGRCLSEGRWKSRLKSGCCKRTNAAVNSVSSGTRSKPPSPARREQPSTGGFKTCCSLKLTILLPLAWHSCSSLVTGFRNIQERGFAQRACQNSSWCETDGQRWDLPFFSKSTALCGFWFVLYSAA